MVGPHRLPCETPPPNPPGGGLGADTRWVLPATILGSSIGFIDSSVVNVALPAIQRSLAADIGAVQWVVNGYMLTLASLILLGGSAGDRLGRRRAFIAGLIAFAVASLACALAPSAPWLIGARLAQGAAAAVLTPASLAIISSAYDREARGKAIGVWAAAGAMTTALGPPIGGWLVDSVGWRSIFFINPPIALAALLLALKLPPDRAPAGPQSLDLAGAALATLALGLISFGLIALGDGATSQGLGTLAAALPASALFLWRETRAKAPMMPLDLFRNRAFSGANALTVLLYAALSGALFLLPFVLIQAHGYSAAAAGAAFLPFSAIMGLGSRWTGGLADRFGSRLPLTIGPALTALGFVVLGLSGSSPNYWTDFLPGLIVVGAGMTIAVAPLTTTVFNAAPEEMSGTASGVNNAAARTGGLLAVAALGLAFGGTQSDRGGGEVLLNAYRLVMLIAAGLAVLSAATAWLTIPPREPEGGDRR